MSHRQALPPSRRPIPFACAGDAGGMHTEHHMQAACGVDPEALDRHVVEMCGGAANEARRDRYFPTGRPLGEALGYPVDLLGRLAVQPVSSFAGVGYHLGLARLLSCERVFGLGSGSAMDMFAAATQVDPGGSVTGVDITPEQLAKSERLRRDLYLENIAAAGLELLVIQANPGYRFASERAQRTSCKYGVPAYRCWRSSRYLHSATSPTRIRAVALGSRKRPGRRVPPAPQRPRRSK